MVGILQPVLYSRVRKLKFLGVNNVKVTVGAVSEYHVVLAVQWWTQEGLLGINIFLCSI